jgi:two-component system OmpR family response regulator
MAHTGDATCLAFVPENTSVQHCFITEICAYLLVLPYNSEHLRQGSQVIAVPHILVVDDDEELLALIKKFLERYDYSVEVAGSGSQMDTAMASRNFDALILDVMLPGEDGLSLCKRVRAASSSLSIIMLTAVTETTDRIVGLELGADDYLAKPFDARELLARIRALLRRSTLQHAAADHHPCLRFGSWHLDLAKRELRSSDMTLVPLSSGEFELLLAFLEHPQRLLTREQLIDYARGSATDVFDRSIDVQISRIRRKIETDTRNPEVIRTVRNAGYIFTMPVERTL